MTYLLDDLEAHELITRRPDLATDAPAKSSSPTPAAAGSSRYDTVCPPPKRASSPI
ncbi:hypothetical protein [Streptomyces hokutonensis]|uniref:hypothetical protein n=1 Tax=Streptomyces hokutonensis TaxID=1306990 RepID=UPI0038220366